MLSRLPHDFPDALVTIMKWRDITVEKLAEEAGLDAKTITRLRNPTDDYTVKKETLIAVCIGLHIPPPLSSELFEKAGIRLNSTELDLTYRFLLNYCWQQHFTTFTLPRKSTKPVYTRPALSPLDFLRFGL